ncbi:unnamed protein product [Thlaspi arvense]|uniref:ATG8-interacting protein 1 n=1 Tax=Thlaspi arvense TaxID=13288 RepID=A0AAU9SKW2_THLAR|nr:unnamed protein product [Thlaspi arvense]
MADKEEASGENTTRGSDWEVVSLTASAYAAAPGPRQVESKDDDDHKEVSRYEAETSHPLYMSRHFVFPPSEHENIELTDDKASKKMDSGFSMEQETGSGGKEDGDLTLKGLHLSSDEYAGLGLEGFEEKGKREENIYNTAMSSLEDERAIGGSHVYEQKEPVHEPTEPVTPGVVPDVSPPTKDEKHEAANAPPCEAWWKRSAATLISQARETNTVWSVFIAAAVMGIVILGQRWQQERWQILQLKWESSIGNEKAGRLMGPISRLKQAFVGGQQRDSFIRMSSQNDS